MRIKILAIAALAVIMALLFISCGSEPTAITSAIPTTSATSSLAAHAVTVYTAPG